MINNITEKAQRSPKRVVFAEADNLNILKAAQTSMEEGVAIPILLGRETKIRALIEEFNIELEGVLIVDPKCEEERPRRKAYGLEFFERRQRKGMTEFEAVQVMRERNHFGSMMVEMGDADAMVSGITRNYRDVIRPAIQVVGLQKGVTKIAGMYILNTKRGPLFLADTTINLNPTAEDLAEITSNVAKTIRKFKVTPRVALLSYSNFGSSIGEDAKKMSKAVKLIKENDPNLIVDGEVQANFALNNELMNEQFSFSELANKKVNTLIFPNLSSGNIAYKLLQEMTDGDAIGPIVVGLRKSIHVLQLGASVREIINMVKIAVVDSQNK